jgi:general secretion pathway protein A
MYSDYFGIKEHAFSITPDPRFLFRSEQHCEALAHLLYGVVESGCFVLLTGEVGTGKTTICRTLLEQLPENVDIALLLNPPQSGRELLLAIHDELHICINQRDVSLHELVYVLTRRLLENHSSGRRTVVIIDEAQNIAPDVLEQVRLLTNLETRTEKLLHVFLVGQPELRELLRQPSLRQVAQRITARYHLDPLNEEETRDYICHRLSVAGCRQGLFSDAALHRIYRESKGVPRVINILCDRALLGAFASDQPHVSSRQIYQAARQWRGEQPSRSFWTRSRIAVSITAVALLSSAALVSAYVGEWPGNKTTHAVSAVVKQVTTQPEAAAHAAGAEPSHPMQPSTEQVPEAVVQPPTPPQTQPQAQPPATRSSASLQPTPLQTAAARPAAAPATVSTVSAGIPGQSRSTTVAAVTNADEPSPLPAGIKVIGPGSPPHAVRWLRHELDRIEGIVSPMDAPVFDNELRRRVMAQQRNLGLEVDGLAGPRTLHYLHMYYGTPSIQHVGTSQPRS